MHFVWLILLWQCICSENAYITFYYDNSPDSAALHLAIRVLMKSIQIHSNVNRIVAYPMGKVSDKALIGFRKDGIKVVGLDILDAYLNRQYVDVIGALDHFVNLGEIWEHVALKKLNRLVYLDAENIVVGNMDEVFICRDMCAVDNSQSVVYANSLLVINPKSIMGKNVLMDAVENFKRSGKEYDYVGIKQGFLPKLFEQIEDGPYFNSTDMNSDAVIKRLPFYYSINHMVYYERLNWDLYQCNNPNKNGIPGPLLTFKYGGAIIKPWFWLSYSYFNINYHWLQVRESLHEAHFMPFILHVLLAAILWWTFIYVCYWYRPIHRLHRFHYSPMTILVASIMATCIVHLGSIFLPPSLMHPYYACKLWLWWQVQSILGVLVFIYMTFQGINFKFAVEKSAIKVKWILLAQVCFLCFTNAAYYSVRKNSMYMLLKMLYRTPFKNQSHFYHY